MRKKGVGSQLPTTKWLTLRDCVKTFKVSSEYFKYRSKINGQGRKTESKTGGERTLAYNWAYGEGWLYNHNDKRVQIVLYMYKGNVSLKPRDTFTHTHIRLLAKRHIQDGFYHTRQVIGMGWIYRQFKTPAPSSGQFVAQPLTFSLGS